jgi:hypothetical protein
LRFIIIPADTSQCVQTESCLLRYSSVHSGFGKTLEVIFACRLHLGWGRPDATGDPLISGNSPLLEEIEKAEQSLIAHQVGIPYYGVTSYTTPQPAPPDPTQSFVLPPS